MKNLELLPLEEDVKKKLAVFARMYRQNHIVIEIVSFEDSRLIVRIEQKDLINDKRLNKKELTERVREMFAGKIPDTWKLTVSAVDYDRKDIDSVSPDWIRRRMNKLGLKNKNINVYTGIDKSTISLILNGEKELTKWHKLAFYYFFKYYEINDF
jgi:hypothetical protein